MPNFPNIRFRNRKLTSEQYCYHCEIALICVLYSFPFCHYKIQTLFWPLKNTLPQCGLLLHHIVLVILNSVVINGILTEMFCPRNEWQDKAGLLQLTKLFNRKIWCLCWPRGCKRYGACIDLGDAPSKKLSALRSLDWSCNLEIANSVSRILALSSHSVRRPSYKNTQIRK